MSSVNDQIIDSVGQVNTLLTGGSAAQAMGMLDVTGTETMGMSMFNAVTAQQNAQTSSSAAATASCAKMLQTASPVAAPLSNKDMLTLQLQKIELAEQKAALMLAVQLLFAQYQKANSAKEPADIAKALKTDVATAVTEDSEIPIDSAQIDAASKLVDADIDSMSHILVAIEAAKKSKK